MSGRKNKGENINMAKTRLLITVTMTKIAKSKSNYRHGQNDSTDNKTVAKLTRPKQTDKNIARIIWLSIRHEQQNVGKKDCKYGQKITGSTKYLSIAK